MTATSTPTLTARLDALFKPWNRSDAPGFVVGVARHGEVLYRRGFGLASIEHAKANTPSIRMRIGSTTKQFCALAILLLREDGKLELDRRVRTYLPELAGVAGEPTLRQLLHHTGGLRDPTYAMFLQNRGTYAHAPEGSNLGLLGRFTERNFAPGESIAYSNAGYYLLSRVIERLAGTSLDTFFGQRLFEPLGLRDTILLRSDLAIVPNVASLHLPQPDGSWRRGIYPTDELLGSGGLISTVDDMLAWSAHARSARKIVGSTESWALMLERPRFGEGEGVESDYCLGLVRETHRGVELLQHAGATLGSQCQLLTVTQHGLDIVVMSNRMDGAAPALAIKILEAVLEPQLQPPKKPASPDDFAALQGRWFCARTRTLIGVERIKLPSGGEGMMLHMHHAPAGLLLDAGGVPTRRLAGTEPVEFRNVPAGAGPLSELQVHVCGRAERFERLPPEPPAAAELAAQLCGRYRYAEFGAEVAIVLDGGKLHLDFLPPWGRAQWELAPLSSDVVGCGVLHSTPPQPLPNPAAMVVAREHGVVRGFWLMSDRVRHVWFERIGA
jgi:D-aminopeptidase